MPESTYDVLARILRDNDAEVARCAEHASGSGYGTYRDGLEASSARLRAAMVGMARAGQTTWQGSPPDPLPTSPPDRGRVIDADFSTVDEPGHSEWKPPPYLPSA